MSGFFRRVLIGLGILATQLLLFVLTTVVSYRMANARFTRNVEGAPPAGFPVVVITSDGDGRRHASAIWHENLAAFLSLHPNHSFAIPLTEEAAFRAEIESATRARGNQQSSVWFATFKTRMRDDGVQEVEAMATGDDDYENTGWYEVRAGVFTPRRHRYYFGPGVGMLALPLEAGSILLNLAGWLGALKLYARRKKRAQEESERRPRL